MNPAMQGDLKQQLRRNFQSIGVKYASYVRFIRKSLTDQKVSVEDLYSFLLTLPFEYGQSTATELEKAKTLEDIFIALEKCSSFWDYEVFQYLVGEYDLDENHKKLQYVKHFDDYIQKHNVSQFVKINPELEMFIAESKDSKKIILKFDIDTVQCELAKVNKLKDVVATSLDIKPSLLQLLSIAEGCVEVTFLIPTPKADAIFTSDWKQVSEQSEELEDASLLSVTYDNNTLDIKKGKSQSKDQKNKAALLSSKYECQSE